MTRKILYIILVAMVSAACTEKIDLKLDTTYTGLWWMAILNLTRVFTMLH